MVRRIPNAPVLLAAGVVLVFFTLIAVVITSSGRDGPGLVVTQEDTSPRVAHQPKSATEPDEHPDPAGSKKQPKPATTPEPGRVRAVAQASAEPQQVAAVGPPQPMSLNPKPERLRVTLRATGTAKVLPVESGNIEVPQLAPPLPSAVAPPPPPPPPAAVPPAPVEGAVAQVGAPAGDTTGASSEDQEPAVSTTVTTGLLTTDLAAVAEAPTETPALDPAAVAAEQAATADRIAKEVAAAEADRIAAAKEEERLLKELAEAEAEPTTEELAADSDPGELTNAQIAQELGLPANATQEEIDNKFDQMVKELEAQVEAEQAAEDRRNRRPK